MQTSFTDAQRANPVIAESEAILRKCVHCGFCTATCPTYVLVGDELDSPRGRIYLIKDMLENERPATVEVARHVDRCLSCLSCMTTCPSGVDYRRLVDRARVHIEQTYRRPRLERLLRGMLARVLPYPARFRRMLTLARLAQPFARWLPARLGAMLELVPARGTSGERAVAARTHAGGATHAGPKPAGPNSAGQTAARVAAGAPRVIVLTGCVQAVVGSGINAATQRLLRRAGAEVVTVGGCCGSIVHHLGREAQSRELARALLAELDALTADGGIAAIVSNASGCGSQLKDLAHQFRDDARMAAVAARVESLTRDVTEIVASLGLPARRADGEAPAGTRVAYHAACSMQHGLRLHEPPRRLLRDAGFDVVEIPEAHLCCGSAGTYNMLQPELARQLGERKLGNIARTGVAVVAAGNLGCLTQLATRGRNADAAAPSFVHTVELLDWATGGPKPPALG